LTWALALTPSVSRAVALSDLFNGQTLTADDKLFKNWTQVDLVTTNGGFSNPALIDVTPLINDPLDPGVKYTAPSSAIGTPFGHTGPSSVILTFSFDVQTTNQQPLIKDNSLLINDWLFDASPNAFIQISEDVLDAGLISAAQRIEHYEIAAYGTVCAYADLLGEAEQASLLGETLEEEKEADQKLTQLSDEINVEANKPSTSTDGEQRGKRGSKRKLSSCGSHLSQSISGSWTSQARFRKSNAASTSPMPA